MQEQEKQATTIEAGCLEWKVDNHLDRFARGPAANRYTKPIEAWMMSDPWIAKVWLPANADWRSRAARPRPGECK
jgi:hypothetical protein